MTDRQYADLLDLHIAKYGRENQFIEFKSNHLNGRKLGQYLSALSNGAALCNEDYGYLYFGIDDDTLAIKGTSFSPSAETVKYKGHTDSRQPLELFLRQYLTPKLNFTIRSILANNGNPVVVFRIPAAKGEPTAFMNIPYVRVDSSVTDMRPYSAWMRQIYNSSTD